MHYEEFEPNEQLTPYVKCFWTLDSDDPGPHEKQRIFPDGSIEWIFHYKDGFRKFTDETNFTVQSNSFLHGQLKRYFDLQASGKRGIFSVRFHPAGLQPFVDFSVDTITDQTLPTLTAWPQEGMKAFVESIIAATTNERIELVSNFLLQHYNPKRDDVGIRQVVERLLTTNGNCSVEELSSMAAMSRRVLERRFQSAVGLSPKHLARIIRFNYLLQLIERSDFSTFTSLAHESGFYDQAHFIRDFRDITGLNPRQYFAENMELVRFFNLSDY